MTHEQIPQSSSVMLSSEERKQKSQQILVAFSIYQNDQVAGFNLDPDPAILLVYLVATTTDYAPSVQMGGRIGLNNRGGGLWIYV
jgi:hypothetical protein